MRAWRTGGLALLCVAVAAGLAAGQQPSCRRWGPDRQGLLDGWFGAKPAPKPNARGPAGPKAEPPGAEQPKGEQPLRRVVLPTGAGRARDQERQLNAYQRRVDVCTRLREVARENNDSKLEEEAARLEEKAAQVLEQHLGPAEDPAGKLEGGAAPGGERPAERTAGVREGK
jgi:hypothetical protein